jgi:hypothetical protein
MLIATNTRVGGFTSLVGILEIIDDTGLKDLVNIPDVERDV